MSTKRGCVTELIQVGPKFAQLRISSGQKVELPLALWDLVQARYRPDQELVFVERRGRIFSFVQWVGTDSEAVEAVRSGDLAEREYRPVLGWPRPSAQVDAPWDPPTTLDEALSRLPMPPVPPGMRDPGTDANLAAYARSLTTATWRDWQVVHLRADRPKVVDLYQSLSGRVGEDQAKTMCTIANRAGLAVNSLVLGYFGRQIDEAKPDRRLVVTWCDIGDAHGRPGPYYEIVVDGAWGILLRDLLAFDARNECYQPFARCVDAAVFGLEGVYQWGVEGPA